MWTQADLTPYRGSQTEGPTNATSYQSHPCIQLRAGIGRGSVRLIVFGVTRTMSLKTGGLVLCIAPDVRSLT